MTSLATADGWAPLLRAGRRLATIPEGTRTWRALRPVLAEGEVLLRRIVAGVALGQPEQRDAEDLAEAYRRASPEQRRSIIARGREYVQRLHAAVREQIRRLVAGGATGAVLTSLRESEVELRRALGAFGGAMGVGMGIVLAAMLLVVLMRKRGR